MNIFVRFNEYLNNVDIDPSILKNYSDLFNDYNHKVFTETYINEARVTLELIEPYLDKDKLILEIGSGLGILSAFLHDQGYKITALEPAQGGFEFFQDNKVLARLDTKRSALHVINIPAEQLDSDKHGLFDLIFSNNVLEHIPDLDLALKAMFSVLNTKGMMIHSCPNYKIPYEPHFGIPVLPFIPSLSKFLFYSRVKKNIALWDSLNFITADYMKSICKLQGMKLTFIDGVMYEAFERLDLDEVYKKRQSSKFISFLWGLIKLLRLNKLIKKIPPAFSTPMKFIITH